MPKMNAYRAIYSGPQTQGGAATPGRTERGAMSYAELGKGTVEEHEAVQSTVLNCTASGHKYWARGGALNERKATAHS